RQDTPNDTNAVVEAVAYRNRSSGLSISLVDPFHDMESRRASLSGYFRGALQALMPAKIR
ncbi:hypothetical protein, partial [Mesorhizobium sp. M7A.F.Ca.US.006.01.1.1]